MAFETLRSALAQEFVNKKQFGRQLDLQKEANRDPNVLAKLAEAERVRQARARAEKFFLGLDKIPMSTVKEKMTPAHIRELAKLEDIGDPEELRRAENRIKFSVLADEQVLSDIATGLPELSKEISGIGLPKGEVSGKVAVEEAKTKGEIKEIGVEGSEERKSIEARGEQERLNIKARGVEARKNIRKRAIEKKKLDPKGSIPPEVKLAMRTIELLEREVQAPPVEGEDIEERNKKIAKRMNQWIKYANDKLDGKDVDIPEVSDPSEDGLYIPEDLFEEIF